MGPTGVGKSSFIRSAIPQGVPNSVQVGHGLQSETSRVQAVHWETHNVKLVDTPGFDDSRSNLTDVDVLRMIVEFLTTESQSSELVGLIYMHRITDTRVGATSQRNLRMFQKLCGLDAMKNVAIVTTMWDKVASPDEGSRREKELEEKDNLFKPLVARGAKMMRHNGTSGTASNVIDYLLKQGATTTQIVREIAEKKALVDTEAGAELQAEIRTLLKRHKEEIQQMEEEIKNAKQGDTAALKEIEEEKGKSEDQLARLKRELEKLRCGLWDRGVTTMKIMINLFTKKTRRLLHLGDPASGAPIYSGDPTSSGGPSSGAPTPLEVQPPQKI